MKLKTISLSLILFTYLPFAHSVEENFLFNTELEVDKKFVKANKVRLLNQYDSLLKYFRVRLKKPVRVEILPYKRNFEFKNCARIYGPYRIYAHSPNSLSNMPEKERKLFNTFCFGKTYDDLYLTLVHEFIHSLTHINADTGKVPKWIWEGIAVSMSGEPKSDSWKIKSLRRLKNYKKIDICQSNITQKDIYLVGGAVFLYLEKSYPKLILNLVQHLRIDPNFSKPKVFFMKYGQKCSVEMELLRKTLTH